MNHETPSEIRFGGFCDERFAAVREAFQDNFASRGEPGAAVAVALDGHVVVDLWGGWADRARTRPWVRDTLVNVFSVSKALAAVCVLRLVERSLVGLDEPVAHVWPEFAAQDKDAVTLRHILAHRAGLPALRPPMQEQAMFDWQTMTDALAAEPPWWPPGAAHGYHVNTFGFLVGEVARRVTGRSLGTLLREEIAGPLEADIHVGLAKSEHHRVAEFLWPAHSPARPDLSDDTARMRWNAYWNPPGLSGAGFVNSAEWRCAELPSANGHATARGVARVYAALARRGEIGGVRILSGDMLEAAIAEQSYGIDRVLDRTTRFGLGFQLTHPERLLGPNPGAFGHFGAGGALGFCDPDGGLAFGYVTSDMGPRWQNPRNQALIDAVYACL